MSERIHEPDIDRICDRLDNVDDPELGRSVTDLSYVDEINVNGYDVALKFQLPTAWCSPAFAWMMATGMRDEVEALPSVREVTVTLVDHMHAENINRGVNQRLDFEETFFDANDDLVEVRDQLLKKKRLADQYELIKALQEAGLDSEQITGLGADDFKYIGDQVATYLAKGSFAVAIEAELFNSYLESAAEVDLRVDEHLFVSPEGQPLDVDEFETVYRRGRLAKNNMEGQATICTHLHEVRNGVPVTNTH